MKKLEEMKRIDREARERARQEERIEEAKRAEVVCFLPVLHLFFVDFFSFL